MTPDQLPSALISCGLSTRSRADQSRRAVRLISANRTLSRICTAGGATRLSMTVAPVVCAICTARATELGSLTFPDSVMAFRLAVTLMSSSGMSDRRKRSSPGASAVISTEYTRTCP